MKTRKKSLRTKVVSLILVFLMFLSGTLTAGSDTVHAYSTDAYPLHYDIPVTVVISPDNANTPDPGQQVFHFRIWSDAGVYMEISNNKVETNGFGTFEGHLTFSVLTHEEAETLCNSTVRIQQYDGNENWQFDTHQVAYAFDFWTISLQPTEPNSQIIYNVYRPVAPPPPQRVNYTLPLNVNIRKASESTPNPGQAVFHFRIWSDSGAALEITNNAIVTNGLGEFRANLSFSVAPEQADAFEMSLLHVQQYDGNADWQFDMYTFTFIYGEDTDANPCFYRDAREGEIAPYGMAYNVYVTNTYQAAPPAPPPVEPVQPEEPEPEEPSVDPANEPSVDPDSGQEEDPKFSLKVKITWNKTYFPKNGKYYCAGEPVVFWVNVQNATSGKNINEIYVYDEDGQNLLLDSHLYYASMAGKVVYCNKLLPWYSLSFMYYHVITPEEALAGKYVFSCYASGYDPDGRWVSSDTATSEVKTSGVYDGKENSGKEKPKKTRLTVELHESSQPEHREKNHEYYIRGEIVRYKVVVKNETDKTFYDIVVMGGGNDKKYYMKRMLPGRTWTFYYSKKVTRRSVKRGYIPYYAVVTYKDKDQNTFRIRTPIRSFNVGTQE